MLVVVDHQWLAFHILMKSTMKFFLLPTMLLCFSVLLKAQNKIESCIINIENGKAYLDITPAKVKVGDVLSIYTDAGYMVHPVTKKKIKKKGEILADLEIVEIHNEYSVATIYPEEAVRKIKVGMIAEMPELPQNYVEKAEVAESVEQEYVEEELPIVPEDADGIVRRYLRVTGWEKQGAVNLYRPLSFKANIAYTTFKDKSFTSRYSYVRDASQKKLYVASIASQKSRSFVSAINGNEGWVGCSGIVMKHKGKEASKIWDNFTDMVTSDLEVFDSAKWSFELGGKRIIRGKQCSGVVFIPNVQGKGRKVFYFDDATGLVAYSEDEESQVEFLEYQTFGNLVLCSKKEVTYQTKTAKKNGTKKAIVTLQEICFDCPLDNSLFTKEGVKRAFKS